MNLQWCHSLGRDQAERLARFGQLLQSQKHLVQSVMMRRRDDADDADDDAHRTRQKGRRGFGQLLHSLKHLLVVMMMLMMLMRMMMMMLMMMLIMMMLMMLLMRPGRKIGALWSTLTLTEASGQHTLKTKKLLTGGNFDIQATLYSVDVCIDATDQDAESSRWNNDADASVDEEEERDAADDEEDYDATDQGSRLNESSCHKSSL